MAKVIFFSILQMLDEKILPSVYTIVEKKRVSKHDLSIYKLKKQRIR
jgi:hypothetical protein